MTTAVEDRIDKRQAAIHALAEVVADEADDVDSLRRLLHGKLCGMVNWCEKIACLWQELVGIVKDAVEDDRIRDLRGTGRKLRDLCAETEHLYSRVAYLCEQHRYDIPAGAALRGLTCEIAEINQTKLWLSGWPSLTDAERANIKEELSGLEPMTDDELAGMRLAN